MTQAVEKVRTLEECEASIERCLKSFWEMGEDYRCIRDNNLYKQGEHKTRKWADYCKERWGLANSTVHEVIQASEIRARLAASNIRNSGHVLPQNTYQTLALRRVDKEEQPAVWVEAVEGARASGREQPTHEELKRVVDRRRETTTPNPQPTPDNLGHEAAKRMRHQAEGFAISVENLMPHLKHLEDAEAQGCAYEIVKTVHAVIGILEDHGFVGTDVAHGVLGDARPEEGLVEIVS